MKSNARRLAVWLAGVGMAIWVCVPAAMGQAPLVPPAEGLDITGARNLSIDDLEYVNTFEEFVYSPFNKLKNSVPDAQPPPLIEPYDSLVGLSPATATSRLALTDRTIFHLPIVEVRVGEEFDVPLVLEQGGPVSALVAWIAYDPKIAEGLAVSAPKDLDWDLEGNLEPDPTRPGQGRLVTVQVSLEPKITMGTLAKFRMKALAPGDTRLIPYQFDASGPTFYPVRCVIRDGLIRVRP